jgi:hypothetical protein
VFLEVGDRLLVTDRNGQGSSHVCRVVSAWGLDGAPPYLVLRYDTGTEEILVPNPDLRIRVLTHAQV